MALSSALIGMGGQKDSSTHIFRRTVFERDISKSRMPAALLLDDPFLRPSTQTDHVMDCFLYPNIVKTSAFSQPALSAKSWIKKYIKIPQVLDIAFAQIGRHWPWISHILDIYNIYIYTIYRHRAQEDLTSRGLSVAPEVTHLAVFQFARFCV